MAIRHRPAPVYFGFREYLWAVLPESRAHILSEELSEILWAGSADSLSAYRFMSGAFFRPVLVPAARTGDLQLARRCIALIEEMLASGDQNLIGTVRIRVILKAYQAPEVGVLLRRFAGPLTRADLAAWNEDATFLRPGAALPPPAAVTTDDGRPDARTWAVRSWFFDTVPALREHLLRTELAEVRATRTLAAMTADRYFSEAFVGGLLPAAAETAVEEGDTSLIDAAATGLELALVCDGDIPVAQLVRDHAAELTADDALTLFLRVYAGPRFGELLATW
jgi:hypothetical protein